MSVTHSLLKCLLLLMRVAKRDNLPRPDTELQTTLGIVVRACRQNLGITQEELAWRANLHRTYIADVERGSRNISLRSIANLAGALQVSVGNLLSFASGGLGLRPKGDRTQRLATVLLVEDDATDAELALRALKHASFRNPVKLVVDGEQALDYLFGSERRPRRGNTTLPVLVLLDLGLPKTSGLEVLGRIKSDQRTRSIPVVVLTGSRQDRNITESARLGAANYILKPVGFDDLSRVSSKLDLRWSLRGSPTTKRKVNLS